MSGIGQPGMPEALQNLSDPNSLPAGHPMRILAEQLGVQGGPSQAPQAPQGFAGVKGHLDPEARPSDPLAVPFMLPSGGLHYGGHSGKVLISPMRGEQQEIMAGAADGLGASPVFRHVVQACTHTQGIPFSDLTMEDFSAVMLNVIALSLGTDEIPMMPTCDKCARQFNGTKSLAEWPARFVRRVGPGEPMTWPPAETENESEDHRILREMGLMDGDTTPAPQTIYTAPHIDDVWEVPLANGQRVGLRYLRVRDWEMAEDYAERSGSTGVSPQAALGRFLRARAMATLDGKSPGMLPLMEWCRQAPMPLLVEMDEEVNRRTYGYVLSPMFRCPSCSHRFRQQLPLSGDLMRRRTAFS